MSEPLHEPIPFQTVERKRTDNGSVGLGNSLAVETRGLTKRYGKNRVVDGLSISIPRGTVYGLIGPNGAGKSTTLKMLVGLLRISEGAATVLGQDIGSRFQSVKHRVGYVPETHHIYRWMRVKRVIQFVKSFYTNWNDEICKQMMETMELDPNKLVRNLSKGMLAKLALLIAVSHEPELLILDEPLSGLDPIVRDEFINGVMQTICERETTVIFSSHTIADVQRLADSIGLLYEGKLLVNRPLEELLATTKRIRVVMSGSEKPIWYPDSTINSSTHGREWNFTLTNYSPLIAEQMRMKNRIEHMNVDDINLEELFKDYIIGERERRKLQQKRATT